MKNRLWHMAPYVDAPVFRVLHATAALLVFFQIINANFTEKRLLSEDNISTFMTWVHMGSGMSLMIIGVWLLMWMLSQRGFLYYFAWLKFDFSGIAQDIDMLKKRQLPDAHSGGTAAMIQGLGVLALFCVAVSGLAWFLLENMHASAPLTNAVIHWHKFLTLFIEIYFFAHGSMGILHLFLRYRKNGELPINNMK